MTGLHYRNTEVCVARLFKEYLEHNNLIIGVDFDNTIYDTHGRGIIDKEVTNIVSRALALGLEVFCFTANTDHALVENFWLNNFGTTVPINSNSLDHLFRSRKPFYSILLDDRAGLSSSFDILKLTLDEIDAYSNRLLQN